MTHTSYGAPDGGDRTRRAREDMQYRRGEIKPREAYAVEDHIQRLERLVLDAIYARQKASLDGEAHRLRRGLGKH